MKFVAVRAVQLVVVLLAVTFFTYSLTFVSNTPDEVVDTLLQIEAGSPDRREAIAEGLNVDDPLLVRYGKWLGDAVTGDLGFSYTAQAPVADRIETRLPRTLALVVYAQLIALLLAIPAGIIAAWRADTWIDRGLSSSSIGMLAVPNYVVAVLLVFLFGLQFQLFPVVITGNELSVFNVRAFFLPAMSLALGQVAVYMRLLRTDMIATLQEDFIGMAKAKGLTTRAILFRHALRPSSLSLVTTIGVNAGATISGAVIIETIFSIPGMGTMLIDAIFRRDILVVQGVVAVIAVGFVVINFTIDLLYALLDPRIRSVRSAA